jgi:hypothetical protein
MCPSGSVEDESTFQMSFSALDVMEIIFVVTNGVSFLHTMQLH